MHIRKSVQRATRTSRERMDPGSQQSNQERKQSSISSNQSRACAQRPAAVLSASKFGVPRPVTCKLAHQPTHAGPTNNRRTHRIPPRRSGEAISVAARVRASRDVIQRTRRRAIQERVQEPKRALPRARELVIQERDDARKHGARARRAIHAGRLAADDNLELHALRRDVGVRAARGVEEALVRGAERLEVRRDGVLLVRRYAEVVREPARREVGGGLGADALRRADGCQAGTASDGMDGQVVAVRTRGSPTGTWARTRCIATPASQRRHRRRTRRG